MLEAKRRSMGAGSGNNEIGYEDKNAPNRGYDRLVLRE